MSQSTPLHKISVTRSRPAASAIQSTTSPHTPLSRSVSGLYGSPGSSFRIDDENLLIFEFGTRCLRAGFAGESHPRCRISYTPELWRRAGDFRQWEVGYEEKRKGRTADGYELWRSDVRGLDLGVVEDRVEKLVREAESRYLLLDNRARRVALAAPSALPRPLLNVVLRKLFEGLQAVSVTILPSSILSAVGAGVRSALVLDLGWEESTVTAVCEYREVRQVRSVRAGKMFSQELGTIFNAKIKKDSKDDHISFEEVEEILCRMAWCQDISSTREETTESNITIPFPKSRPPATAELQIPFSTLAEPAESALFAKNIEPRNLDDHDLPLHHLLYNALLHLPADIRNLCMSHIIITGGISNIPGLKRRILNELKYLVSERGWDHIRSYTPRLRSRPKTSPLSETSGNATPRVGTPTLTRNEPEEEEQNIPAHARLHDTNNIDIKLSQVSLSSITASKGEIRAINTLGPWAGASLVSNLRIKGVVEVERERFLQYGFVAGAVKKDGTSTAPEVGYSRSRQSLGPKGLLGGEKGGGIGWSLGVWG